MVRNEGETQDIVFIQWDGLKLRNYTLEQIGWRLLPERPLCVFYELLAVDLGLAEELLCHGRE